MWQFEKNYRLAILGGVIVLIIGLLVFRLAWLQLLQGPQYKKQAEQNRIRQRVDYAPRGEILDRNQAMLVSSRPSFAVSIIPAEFTNHTTAVKLLAAISGVTSEEILAKLKEGDKSPYTPLRLKQGVDTAMITKIEERSRDLPGVIIEPIAVRHYLYGQLAAQLFGYVSSINAEEYSQRQAKGYTPQDIIGKSGLEKLWEHRLRGINGGKQVEINAAGEELRSVGEALPTPGHSLVLSLDANLQKAAEDALEKQIIRSNQMGEPAKGGAVVALNTRTGGVMVMASKPAYDPNVFADGLNTKEWNAIVKNTNQPLTNRAIAGVYPPASVFKIVTAAAALDTGLTSAEEVFEDKGVYTLSGWKFYGWKREGLGRLNLAGALSMSSDPVFYELGHRLGANKLADYALTFGYGKPSEIGLPEEKGLVPTEEWKVSTYGEQWYPGETLIAAIGQGYYLATPLQQTLLLMAVANGGVMYRPLLVEKVLSPQGEVIEAFGPEVLRTVYLKPEDWETIRKGLLEVTLNGTASVVFKSFPHTVAGKTGSAETGRKATHAWFACYAPAEAPEIALTVFVEDGGEGSVAAAPIARKILEAYFGIVSAGEPPTPGKGEAD